MQFALNIIGLACPVGGAACLVVTLVCQFVAPFYRKPGISWLEAAFTTTILLQPFQYTERGLVARRGYIMGLKGFFIFVCIMALLMLLEALAG